MKPLPHSYTNDTRGDDEVVVKRFRGPDWATRRLREYTVLDKLRGRLPVPGLRDSDDSSLCTEFVAGIHGQELIEAGHAAPVLRASGCGSSVSTSPPRGASSLNAHGSEPHGGLWLQDRLVGHS